MTGWTVLTATHAFAGCVGLSLGAYQLLRRVKGDRRHRVVGGIWVVGMVFVATSSFAIRNLRDGQLSLLHVLSVVTVVSMAVGVVQARHGRIAAHKGAMIGSWTGLVGAFIGAVAVPSRLIPTFAVANPWGAVTALLAVLVTSVALLQLAMVLEGRMATGPAAHDAAVRASITDEASPGFPGRAEQQHPRRWSRR